MSAPTTHEPAQRPARVLTPQDRAALDSEIRGLGDTLCLRLAQRMADALWRLKATEYAVTVALVYDTHVQTWRIRQVLDADRGVLWDRDASGQNEISDALRGDFYFDVVATLAPDAHRYANQPGTTASRRHGAWDDGMPRLDIPLPARPYRVPGQRSAT